MTWYEGGDGTYGEGCCLRLRALRADSTGRGFLIDSLSPNSVCSVILSSVKQQDIGIVFENGEGGGQTVYILFGRR